MSYGNGNGYRRNSYGGGYSGGYSRNYSSGYSRGNYSRSNSQPKKKSGAKFKTLEGDAYIVSAWYVRKGVLYSVYARPYKGTKIVTSKSGKEWANLFVTITGKDNMQVTKTSGLLDISSKRLYISDFNLIATSKGSGGYCGVHIKKTYNR